MCDPAELPFASTEEIEPPPVPAGQPRAFEALELAAELRTGGFNVFVTGPAGTGKRTAVLAWLRERARSEPAPPDLVVLPSFADRLRPHTVELPPGSGHDLAADVDRLVAEAGRLLADTFESEGYRTRHRLLHEQLDGQRRELLGRLEARAQALGVALQVTPAGVLMAPVAAGRPLHPDEIARMPSDARGHFESAVAELQEPAEEAFSHVHDLERDAATRHGELDREVALRAVSRVVAEVRERWSAAPRIAQWLDTVGEDVVANQAVFRSVGTEQSVPPAIATTAPGGQLPSLPGRYAVNVLVSNDPGDGAPVVGPSDPSFAALFGRVEYETTFGALVTDHRHLRPGAVHEARGGYLVLDARDVLAAPLVWPRLKDVLRTGRIRIENAGVQYTLFPGVAPEPEATDARLMVVLVGSHALYELLHAVDEDLARLFTVRADFDLEMERDAAGIQAYGALLSRLARDGEAPHFDRGAVAALVEHGSRLAGHQHRLSTRTRPLADLAREAGLLARRDGRSLVGAGDVRGALEARRRRSGLPEQRLRDAILEGTLQVDVSGTCTGQVNGLAVRSVADRDFGHPVRITATVSPGEGQVVDIDREAELSGPLHAKGVLILTGFLGGRYCPTTPLSLRASIVLEQSYGPIEGDSASAAELLALLSALGDVPLDQAIAVTGSIDQHGRIQAIGGVNEKVEGFHALCRERGLTGEQGVLVPRTNLVHTMLDPELIDDVRHHRFQIRPVDTIDDALTVLTGRPAGERAADGSWPAGSINALVQDRLAALSEAARVAHAARGR